MNLCEGCHSPSAGPVYLQEQGPGPRTTSSHTQQKVDTEVERMLRESYSRVTNLLVSLMPITMHTCLFPLLDTVLMHAEAVTLHIQKL